MTFAKLITDKTNTKWLEAEVKISLVWTLYNNELSCWSIWRSAENLIWKQKNQPLSGLKVK